MSSLFRTHFPGLNEFRALAILAIIPGHIEQTKQSLGLPYHYWFPVPGRLGVVLFFCLSGFLISIILLNEQEHTNTISLKRFYYKRILRIWPLYFFLLALVIFAVNGMSFFQPLGASPDIQQKLGSTDVIFLLCILPHYVGVVIPFLGHLWSIGVEEQFYLFQPLLVKLSKPGPVLILLLVPLVCMKEILTFVVIYLQVPVTRPLLIFVYYSQFLGVIALGSLGAVLCHCYPLATKKFLHNSGLQVAALLSLVSLLFLIQKTNENIVDFRIHAVIFTVMIINAATNPVSLYNLNSRVLDYVGRISYGIYMYHSVCIALAVYIAGLVLSPGDQYVLFNSALYITTAGLSIIVAHGSFKYLETPFLKLKGR